MKVASFIQVFSFRFSNQIRTCGFPYSSIRIFIRVVSRCDLISNMHPVLDVSIFGILNFRKIWISFLSITRSLCLQISDENNVFHTKFKGKPFPSFHCITFQLLSTVEGTRHPSSNSHKSHTKHGPCSHCKRAYNDIDINYLTCTLQLITPYIQSGAQSSQ